jgi:hypothetical protein
MQHLDDAHGCAESFLSEWIKKKPGRWRILVVKDVLAMIRMYSKESRPHPVRSFRRSF